MEKVNYAKEAVQEKVLARITQEKTREEKTRQEKTREDKTREDKVSILTES